MLIYTRLNTIKFTLKDPIPSHSKAFEVNRTTPSVEFYLLTHNFQL